MIDSLIEPYINERLEEFNESANHTLEEGYKRFNGALNRITLSENLKLELECIFNAQVNEAVRLAHLRSMKCGLLLGLQLMLEARGEK